MKRLSCALLMLTLWGCAPSWMPLIGRTPDLQVQNVRGIKGLDVRRIAVMPLLENPVGKTEVIEGSNETVTAEIYGQMSLAAGWELVPEADVIGKMQQLPQLTLGNQEQQAAELGKLVHADAVLYGTVDRFKERVGLDYAAASPAAVSFTLHLYDVNSKQLVWTGKFVKSQKALTENIFNLVNFLQNQGRWVKAHEIAMEGVRQAVADLHSKLNIAENVKRFPSASYEQYRMGVERYNRQP